MKAEWQVPGRATGAMRCTLRRPAIEKDLRRISADSLLVIRGFIDKHLASIAREPDHTTQAYRGLVKSRALLDPKK